MTVLPLWKWIGLVYNAPVQKKVAWYDLSWWPPGPVIVWSLQKGIGLVYNAMLRHADFYDQTPYPERVAANPTFYSIGADIPELK